MADVGGCGCVWWGRCGEETAQTIEKTPLILWKERKKKSCPRKVKIPRAYRPTTALAQAVEFRDGMMEVYLTDGRIISVPLIWFPLLYEATPEQREHYEIGGGGARLSYEDT